MNASSVKITVFILISIVLAAKSKEDSIMIFPAPPLPSLCSSAYLDRQIIVMCHHFVLPWLGCCVAAFPEGKFSLLPVLLIVNEDHKCYDVLYIVIRRIYCRIFTHFWPGSEQSMQRPNRTLVHLSILLSFNTSLDPSEITVMRVTATAEEHPCRHHGWRGARKTISPLSSFWICESKRGDAKEEPFNYLCLFYDQNKSFEAEFCII